MLNAATSGIAVCLPVLKSGDSKINCHGLSPATDAVLQQNLRE